MTIRKKLKLKIVFDTNVIYTGSASDIFRKEIIELFESHSVNNDIDVEWHVPEIVLLERKFQMNKKGYELLPNIQKLEQLLGHNLNINEEIIETRIDNSIKKQTEKHNIKILKININRVNWENIIQNSIFRKPPFEDNEKEKGFKDALILESFLQLVEDSPVTKSVCRIAFISNDRKLNEAATSLTLSSKNVNIYNNIDELNSLINILTSEITEELINLVASEAGKLFFTKNDESTLFYTEDIRKRIKDEFSDQLSIKAEGADLRENGTWWINKPGFEKKDKQRIFWKSTVDVDFINFKTIKENNNSVSLFNWINSNETLIPTISQSKSEPKKEKINEGKSRFEVKWSVTLTTTKKLKSPKIESIKFIDTIID